MKWAFFEAKPIFRRYESYCYWEQKLFKSDTKIIFIGHKSNFYLAQKTERNAQDVAAFRSVLYVLFCD